MVSTVVLAILVGAAALLAMFAVVLAPAVLVLWFLRRTPPRTAVELRPGDSDLTLAAWIGRESAAIRLTR